MTDDRTEHALRRALDDAARQVDVSVGTLPALEREPAPVGLSTRRAVPALVAIGLLLLAGVVVLVVTRNDRDATEISALTAGTREVSPSDFALVDADVAIVMSLDASTADVAAARARLEASPQVVAFTMMDRDAYSSALQNAGCDADTLPLEGEDGRPVTYPTLLFVTSSGGDAVDALMTAFSNQPGVDRVWSDSDLPTPETPIGRAIVAVCTSRETAEATPAQAPVTATVVPQAVATLPPEATEIPADPDAARAAVMEMWTVTHTGSTPLEERLLHYQDADELTPLVRQAYAGRERDVASMTVEIHEVRFLSPTRAAIQFRNLIGGSPDMLQVQYAVLVDGEWKIARESVCAAIARASVHCPEGP